MATHDAKVALRLPPYGGDALRSKKARLALQTGVPQNPSAADASSERNSGLEGGLSCSSPRQSRGGGGVGGSMVRLLTALPLTADAVNLSQRGLRDYSHMTMKTGHATRPIWVCGDGYLLLEQFLPSSKQAHDFLLTVAEPICSSELIHEFHLTVFSLYAAISVGLSAQELLSNLSKLSKNELPEELVTQIQNVAAAFGKVKLVLNESNYFIESADPRELDHLLSNPLIRSASLLQQRQVQQQQRQLMHLVHQQQFVQLDEASGTDQPALNQQDNVYLTSSAPTLDTSQLAFKTTEPEAPAPNSPERSESGKIEERGTGTLDERARRRVEDSETKKDDTARKPTDPNQAAHHVYSFQVRSEMVEEVKREAIECMQRPLLSEYDFRRDSKNPNITSLLLRSSTKIRYYQERALRKMFSNGRARSGIIVLPCGAGKTLTGITAACTLRKSAVVLTTSAVAVEQWRKQFEEYTTIANDRLLTLTAETKQQLWPSDAAGVLISTYTMLAFSGRRSTAAEKILADIKSREWGMLIFDEVQFAPAPAFRRINDIVRSHCRLGLTATLVREDDLIKDLQWIIGPKLYEANWIELQNQGFLAKVSCQEVWCPMTAEFYREYLRAPHAKQRKLWVCNPTKLMVCEFLLRFHESRGDKVIVFSDNVFALLHVARALNRPFIYGKVSPAERMAILSKFKNEGSFNTLFLSKVGDNAIDIPCANVVIQISFNFASRRQEAQRLGRILRAKPRGSDEEGGFNAYFYSLISKDTLEMVYADKRQQFIIDQGYSYKVLHCRDLPLEPDRLVYGNRERQLQVLRDILISDDTDRSLDEDEEDGTFSTTTVTHSRTGVNDTSGPVRATVVPGGLSALSGGEPSASGAGRGKRRAPTQSMHPLFRKLHANKF